MLLLLALKQVEVAKGAASSLYGSDALGGIVVFTTKDAADYLQTGENFAGSLKLGHNQDGEQNNIGATFAARTGDVEHLFNASYRDGQEAQNFNETKPHLAIEATSFLYKGKVHLNQTDYISWSADIYQQDVKGDYAYGLLEYFRTLNGYDIVAEHNKSEQDSQAFQLRYVSKTATLFYDFLNVSLYHNDTEQVDTEYGQLDIDANFGYPLVEIRDMWNKARYQQTTKGLLSNASLQLNANHTLGYGLDVEHSESLRTEFKLYEVAGVAKPGYPQETEKFPTTEVRRAGLFVNDEISLSNGQLVITPSVRFDTYKMEAQNAHQQDGKEDNTNDYLTSISPLSGTAGINFNVGNFTTDLLLNWAKRMTKVNEGYAEIAGYGTLDMLMRYDINEDLRINVAATNLFDKKYVRYLNGAGHEQGSDLDYLTESGRTISASIHYQF